MSETTLFRFAKRDDVAGFERDRASRGEIRRASAGRAPDSGGVMSETTLFRFAKRDDVAGFERDRASRERFGERRQVARRTAEE